MKKDVYDFVDEMPEYSGRQGELIKYILKKTVYPDQEIAQGKIKLAFIVDTDGSIRGEEIINKETIKYTPLDREVLKVIRLMPKWKPGKCNKKNVPVRVFIPIQLNR